MGKPFVLLADDNEGTCTLIQALLQPEFEVDVASDGAEAIEKLKGRWYEAILIDLLMPLTDGFGVLEHLRDERPEVLSRVLVVTAAVSPREMARVDQYPIAGVIRKPFEIDTLLNAVRTVAGDHNVRLCGPLFSSGVLLLLADLLRQRLM